MEFSEKIADMHLTEADLAYCRKHQEAYESAHSATLKMRDLAEKVAEEQAAIQLPFPVDAGKSCSYYPTTYACGCDTLIFDKFMSDQTRKFVDLIAEYFEITYHVDLSKAQIHAVCRNCKFSGETLRYEEIISEIYRQLNGLSFAERAMSDLRKWCIEAVYDCNKEELFVVEGSVLRLLPGVQGLSKIMWVNYNNPTSKLRAIMDAIGHYESGEFGCWREYFLALSGQICYPEFANCKVVKIKTFKNGQVDIKFKDAESAEDFVATYLREDRK